MDADPRYDNRFELVRIELPRWSCLEGGKGAKKIGNTFFKPAGSSPSANMGVLNEDNEPGIKPESQGGQAYSQKERIALVNKTRIPPSQQIDKYADAFGVSRGQAAADLRDWSNRIGGRYPDPIAAGKLALSEAREIVRSLPDGTLLKAVPVRDATGKARVRTYQKLGFGEMLGGTQWAVKKGGKLIPVDAEFFEAHLRPNANKLKGYSISSVPLVGSAAERRRMERMPRTQETDLSDLADLFG